MSYQIFLSHPFVIEVRPDLFFQESFFQISFDFIPFYKPYRRLPRVIKQALIQKVAFHKVNLTLLQGKRILDSFPFLKVRPLVGI
jgi:hypothetical protein